MSACVYVSVLVWTLTDYDCISIGFSPSEKWCRAQTEKWDQRGKLISLSQTHSSLECGHTGRDTHCKWCPLLLGVLTSLMRCESGTEMEQVEEEKELYCRNGVREGESMYKQGKL